MSLSLSVALAVTGCATAPAAPPEAPAAPAPAASAPSQGTVTATAVTVPASLKFTGTTLEGATFDAASLAGKPAVLWFWAPWCATCASEAQSISDLHVEYDGKLQFLGIAGMGGTKQMKKFVADFQVEGVPHLNDPTGKLFKKFGIPQQSWYVMLDASGEIVHRGYLDDLQLTEKLRTLAA